MNNHEDHSFHFLLLFTSEASYCQGNLERITGYWTWNRFEKTREHTESFLSPNAFHPEPEGSHRLGVCLYRIWHREQSSPFLLRAGIPHILLMRTALKGFWAHIWKTSSPFLPQVLLVPAAKGAGQGTELTGQAGSGKDSARETCSAHIIFRGHPGGVIGATWQRTSSGLEVSYSFSWRTTSFPLDSKMTGEKAKGG